MYVLMNEHGEMFAGYGCGCVISKSHWTRACIYKTVVDAEEDMEYYELEGFTVVELNI